MSEPARLIRITLAKHRELGRKTADALIIGTAFYPDRFMYRVPLEKLEGLVVESDPEWRSYYMNPGDAMVIVEGESYQSVRDRERGQLSRYAMALYSGDWEEVPPGTPYKKLTTREFKQWEDA